MGKDLYESSESVKELFTRAGRIVGKDLTALMFEGSEEELKETENTQIVITLMSLAVRSYLKEAGVEAAGAAGFSLGEWSAYVEAGVISEDDVFPVVVKRAELMAQAVRSDEKMSGGVAMAAVMGLSPEEVEKTIAEIDEAYPANYNAPAQTVISGTKEGIDKAAAACKEAGAKRVLPLKVSGPFHTPLLERARQEFAEYLANVAFTDPVKPLFSNVTGGRLEDATRIRELAAEQIVSPIRWVEEEQNIAAAGFDACIESGPGKVLTGLWKKSDADIPCHPTDKKETIDKLLGEL
jgi:[acyl-carrier-protein] S-malonyltransferase